MCCKFVGESSRISGVVQQAGDVLPSEAHETVTLLHASRTWLQPSQSEAVAATIPTLSPSNTIWCLLAMHTPYQTPGITHSTSAQLFSNLQSPGLPWGWIRSSTVAVARRRYSQNRKHMQKLLQWKIESMARSHENPHVAEAISSMQGSITSAMHSEPVHAAQASSSKLRWPEHAPDLLAGLSLPISRSKQRSALRPLLDASATCIEQCRENSNTFPRGATQAGHWVALLDLVSSAMAVMSKRHAAAVQLVATACEELRAQVDVLPAHYVASSVLLLGEILTKQVCALPRS